MNRNYHLLIALTFCVSACQHMGKPDVGATHIDIDAADNQCPSSLICESIELHEIITPDSIIVNPSGSQYHFFNNHMYLLDSSSKDLYEFTDSYKFVRTVARRGRSSREYQMAEDFLVNERDSTVEILNPVGKIYRYGIGSDTDFFDVIDISDKVRSANQLVMTENGSYFIYSLGVNKYYLYDPSRKITKELGSIIPDYLSTSIIGNGMLFNYKNKPRCFSRMDGKVYTINEGEDKLCCIHKWDFGEHTLSTSLIPENKDYSFYHHFIQRSRKYVSFTSIMHETDSSIIATAIYKGLTNFHSIIYNKQDGSVLTFKNMEKNLLFLPREIYNGNAYYLIEDHRLLPKLVNNTVVNSNNISIGAVPDNPCIVVYKNLKI